LIELRASLDDLERDPSPSRVDSMLTRRQMARAHLEALQGTERRPQPSQLPRKTARRMRQLWFELDTIAIDPIGQRARLALARERIEEALEQPRAKRSLGVTISTPETIEVTR